jgi:hypothetical protein
MPEPITASTDYSETVQDQRERWRHAGAVTEGRDKADHAEAEWRDAGLAARPNVTLACGHLSPPGNGPIAQAGYGYCGEHGVSRIITEAADA